jgi:tetratricopeptide (TPR) repeat protein
LSEAHPNTQQALKDLLFVYKEYAESLISEKKYKEALKIFDSITKYRKDKAAWNYKGLCHYELKAYSKAISAYQKAVEIDNTLKDQGYYSDIGTAYVKNHQFTQAKTAFTEYEKLFPNQGRPYRNWAMFYALQNQKEEALEMLEKAIALGHKDVQWLQTDSSMESLKNETLFTEIVKQLLIKIEK